jgi:acetyl esterase
MLAHALLSFLAIAPQESIVYGNADGEVLTMDYYPARGAAIPHPVAIIIHGGGFTGGTSRNDSEAYCAQFLAPAGYAVFSINYRLAPKHPYPAAVEDVQRATRFIRHNARRWNADPKRIALIGGSPGGYLSNMVGVLDAPPHKPASRFAKDTTDRESSRVQAVVTLFGPSDFRGRPPNDSVKALLGPLIAGKGLEAALAEGSPITHIHRGAPPFLLIHGDKDEAVDLSQSTIWQLALQQAGVACDLIIIRNGAHATGKWHTIPGVRDWEAEMTGWLNSVLSHTGPIGEGIRERTSP